MPQKPDDSQWWLEESVWLDILRPEDPNQTRQAGKLFRRLLVENEKGPEGVARVSVCLQNGIRLIRRFTAMHSALNFSPDKSLAAILSDMLGEPPSNIHHFPTGEILSDVDVIDGELDGLLRGLSFTPFELLGFIIKAVLREDITEAQIDLITTNYCRAIQEWFPDSL